MSVSASIILINQGADPIWEQAAFVARIAGRLFAAVSNVTNVAAGLAGALISSCRALLFAAIFTFRLIDIDTVPVVAVAVLISGLVTESIALFKAGIKGPREFTFRSEL